MSLEPGDLQEALFRTRTEDPLLTMERRRQSVAAGGNRFGLFRDSRGPVDLPVNPRSRLMQADALGRTEPEG